MSWHAECPCATQASSSYDSSSVVALQSWSQTQSDFALLGAADLLVLRKRRGPVVAFCPQCHVKSTHNTFHLCMSACDLGWSTMPTFISF